jgi:hypothetical protein
MFEGILQYRSERKRISFYTTHHYLLIDCSPKIFILNSQIKIKTFTDLNQV